MHQRKSKKILIYFFLLIIVSSIGNNTINNYKFKKIENINIFGLDQKNNQILSNKLKNLSLGNIFFINKKKIEKLINSNSLIESYVIFKEYPSTLNIKIDKTKFFAKINNNGKIYLVGSNGKLTSIESGFNELPYIFGKPKVEELLRLKKIIDSSKFSYNEITNIYFFPSKRWDLKFRDNILLKLPNNLTQETLDNLYDFLENYNGENFNIVDARLENKIVLDE
jgi:cell division septal protein FtsQ